MPVPYRLTESKQVLEPVSDTRGWQTLTNDEMRGLVWLFEEPKQKATYVISCDPAMGMTGWDRTIPQDSKTDNSAIEVFRIGTRKSKITDKDTGKEKEIDIPTDYQVAEFAAPVDYEATAATINALGRLYKGQGRMGVAHTIIEIYPGPGWMVQKALISKHGYMNFYQPKYIDTIMPTAKNMAIGWTANRTSVRDLWIHGTRHLLNGNVVIRSPWLLREMKTTDPLKFQEYRSEAQSGFHDDLLRAAMLNWWAAHDVSSQVKVETQTTIEHNSKPVNWQSSDLSAASLKDEWEKRFSELGE